MSSLAPPPAPAARARPGPGSSAAGRRWAGRSVPIPERTASGRLGQAGFCSKLDPGPQSAPIKLKATVQSHRRKISGRNQNLKRSDYKNASLKFPIVILLWLRFNHRHAACHQTSLFRPHHRQKFEELLAHLRKNLHFVSQSEMLGPPGWIPHGFHA
jgi:hypothetical protein